MTREKDRIAKKVKKITQPEGRPILYNDEMAFAICGLIAKGYSVCKTADTVGIGTSTVYAWLRVYPKFLDMYEKAKEDQADLLAEQILEICDDGRNDWMEVNDKGNEAYKVNGEHVQRSRLRVDARKWMASKLKPRKYGESSRLQAEVKNTSDRSTWLSDTLNDIDNNK